MDRTSPLYVCNHAVAISASARMGYLISLFLKQQHPLGVKNQMGKLFLQTLFISFCIRKKNESHKDYNTWKTSGVLLLSV
jgi:hypothetical protein